MALQLSIYPQTNLNGSYNYTSTAINTELVSDPSFFWAGMFNFPSASTSTGCPSQEAMTATAPISSWRGFYSDGTTYTATTAPTFGSYNVMNHYIKLDASSGGASGIYQKITGLQIGHSYDLVIKFHGGSTSSSGEFLYIGSLCGALPQHNEIGGQSFITHHPNITGTITHTFTAQHTEEVLTLQYHSFATADLKIKKISIRENENTAPLLLTDVDDGQVLLDLMDANSLPITLSIDNFKNVAEKPQSYSKAFNLPSTKKNNRIFSSLYDVQRAIKSDSFSFNPHKRTKAILKDNGYPIFEGYLKLISIKEKKGIVVYNVNLFNDAISLKTVLDNKTFADFDGGSYHGGSGLQELEHDYNKSNIKDSWIGEVELESPLPLGYKGFAGAELDTTTSVLKYPFCIWSTDIYQSPGTGSFPPLNSPVLTDLEDAFRPWIKCKYLLDRIIHEAGFSYSSDFLNSTAFTRIFMDFNWGKEELMTPTTETKNAYYRQDGGLTNIFSSSYSNLQLNTATYASINAAQCLVDMGYSLSTHIWTAPTTTTTYIFDGAFELNISTATTTFDCRIVHKSAGGAIISQQVSTFTNASGETRIWTISNSTWNLIAGETIEFQCKEVSGGVVEQGAGYAYPYPPNGSTLLTVTTDLNPIASSNIMLQKRGKIKQWDYIKDIFTMFNLVIMSDRQNPNNLIIEPYKDVFIDDSQSQYISINTLDWTDKVDMDSMELKPAKLKKVVTFDYKKPKDYANKVYTDATGLQFGSFEIDASDFDTANGTQKIALKVFSPTFLTPVFDHWNIILTVPHITGGDVSSGADGAIDNNPRILYDATSTSTPLDPATSVITLDPDKYQIPAQAGMYSENQKRFGLFSHLARHPAQTSSTDDLDLNFGTHQITGYGGSPSVHNLFNTYWQPYFDELYHADTRIVKLKIALNAQDISTFNFNDQIRIKNRLYRANKIDYKPEALSNVELVLIP